MTAIWIASCFRSPVAGERDQYLMEKRYLRKDGSLFWAPHQFPRWCATRWADRSISSA